MSWEAASYWIEHHPGLASWVQAFGAIAAIGIAIWIASGPDRRRREQVLEGMMFLSRQLVEQLSLAENVYGDGMYIGGNRRALRRSLEDILALTSNVPISDMPGEGIISNWLDSRQCLIEVLALIDSSTDPNNDKEEEISALCTSASMGRRHAKIMQELCRTALEKETPFLRVKAVLGRGRR